MVTIPVSATSSYTFSAADPHITVVAGRNTAFSLQSSDAGTYTATVNFNGLPLTGARVVTLNGANTTYHVTNVIDGNAFNTGSWQINASASKALQVDLSQGGSLGRITAPTTGPLTITVGAGGSVGTLQLGAGPTVVTVDAGGTIDTIIVGSGPVELIGEGVINGIQGHATGADHLALSGVDITQNTLGAALSTGGGNDTITFSGTSEIRNQFAGDLFDTGAGDDRIFVSDHATLSAGAGSHSAKMGEGNDQLVLGAGAQVRDIDVDMGAGSDHVELGAGASFKGGINLGSGASSESLHLKAGARLDGDLTSQSSSKTTITLDHGSTFDNGTIQLGSGNDLIVGADNVFIGGAIHLEGGTNKIELGQNAHLSGRNSVSVTGGSGADTLILGAGASVKGFIGLGAGDNKITIGDNAHLSESGTVITTLAGNDEVSFGHNVKFGGSIHLGAGNDVLTLGQDFTADRVGIVFDGGYSTGDLDVLALQYDPALLAILNGPGSRWQFNGVSYDYTGIPNSQVFVYKGITFRDFERVVVLCFHKGTMIATARGERAIETLEVGDLVVTMDHGLRPLLKLLRRHISAEELAQQPQHRPVIIPKGALGKDRPTRDLWVSPQHRVLIVSPIAERMAGAREWLVPAIKLVGTRGIHQAQIGDVDYFHLVFDRHEVVFAEGAAAEAFHLGPCVMAQGDRETLAELAALFPSEFARGAALAPCRPVLRGKRINRLLARHVKNEKPLVTQIKGAAHQAVDARSDAGAPLDF